MKWTNVFNGKKIEKKSIYPNKLLQMNKENENKNDHMMRHNFTVHLPYRFVLFINFGIKYKHVYDNFDTKLFIQSVFIRLKWLANR